MKNIFCLVIILFSLNSSALDKFAKASVQTAALTGEGTLSMKVPGTFATLDKTSSSWSGRVIQRTELWFANPADGDAVISMTLEDTDGVIPVPQRVAFADYPVLGRREDSSVDDANKGFFLHPNQPMIVSPSIQTGYYASGLYLKIQVKKASAVADTFYANVTWSDSL